MQNKSILDTHVPDLSLFYKHLHSAFECQLQCHNIMKETSDSSSVLPLCFLENAASITFSFSCEESLQTLKKITSDVSRQISIMRRIENFKNKLLDLFLNKSGNVVPVT